MNPNAPLSFSRIAHVVRRRLFARNFVALLDRSALLAALVVMVGVVVVRLTGLPVAGWMPLLAGAGGWGLLCLLLAFWQLPTPASALAIWDEAVNGHEAFLSALYFESADDQSPGASLHLRRSVAEAPARLASLQSDLPVRAHPRLALCPLLAILFVFSPLLKTDCIGVNAPTAAQRDGMRNAGSDLQPVREQLASLKIPDPREQETVKALEKRVEKAASRLTKADYETTREALADLEARARETEKLAQGMGASDDDALSEAMLSALEQHAQTSALATALRRRSASDTSDSLKGVAQKLEDIKTSALERERISKAFESALAAATAKDKAGNFGKSIAEAHKQLQRGNQAAAVEILRKLAEKYAQVARRQATKKKLQQLAQQMRGAGRMMAGRLAPLPRSLAGLPRPSSCSNALPMPGMPPSSSCASNFPNPSSACSAKTKPPVPGSACRSTGNRSGRYAPVPGTRPGGTGGLLGNPFGSQSGKTGGMAPVPGCASPATGAAPMSIPGGSQAGVGSAPLGGGQTTRLSPTGTDVVSGTPGGGPSAVRQVAGQGQAEAASVTEQELILEQIEKAEAGLDDEPLPLSRRDQVRRYFTSMRLQTSNDGVMP